MLWNIFRSMSRTSTIDVNCSNDCTDNSLKIKIKGARYLWAQWLLLVTNFLDHFFFQEVDGDQSEAFVCMYCDSKGKVLTIMVLQTTPKGTARFSDVNNTLTGPLVTSLASLTQSATLQARPPWLLSSFWSRMRKGGNAGFRSILSSHHS